LQVAADLQVTIAAADLLISGYALGLFVGSPLLAAATRRLPRKTVLVRRVFARRNTAPV
jgi:MFS transporter, DHA1 family, inner membrane transport protein